jgi:Bacterial Ig-like domain
LDGNRYHIQTKLKRKSTSEKKRLAVRIGNPDCIGGRFADCIQYAKSVKYLSWVCGFWLLACASVRAPEGGPRDTEPPRLLRVNPAPGSLGIMPKTIALEFSEEVAEDNPKRPFLSPYASVTIRSVGRKFRIEPDSGLLPNTTYTVNLRKKIKDVREGNRLNDTSFVFSTGSRMDTLDLTIQISETSNQPSPATMTAVLVGPGNVRYIAASDSGRQPEIRGLPPSTYYLQVFADKNENYQYEDAEGPLYFDSVHVQQDSTLNIVPLPHRSKPIGLFMLRKGDTCLVESDLAIVPHGRFLGTILSFNNEKTQHKLYPITGTQILEYADSLGNCYEDTFDVRKVDSTRSLANIGIKRERQIVRIGKELEIQYQWNGRLWKEPRTVRWTYDSTWKDGKIKTVQIRDSFLTRIRIPILKEGKLKIVLDTLLETNGRKFWADSAQIAKNDLEPDGKVTGTLESGWKNPILEIVNLQKQVIARSKTPSFGFNLKPGTYLLQVFDDQNQDGRYTGGNQLDRRKAEALYRHPQKIELKPGWDLENIRIKTY